MADEQCPLLSDSVRFNRLGGAYLNGKPLPKWLKREIIALAQSGVRQCDISRRLRITHSCVSKVLSKYQRTSNFETGIQRFGRLGIIATPEELKTDELIYEQPGLFSLDISCDTLRQENLLREAEALRSASSMSHNLLQTGSVQQMEPRTIQDNCAGRRPQMITTSNNGSQQRQQSESCTHTAVSSDLSEGAYFPLPLRKRERIKYTSEQLSLLEAAFQRSKYLTPSIEKRLAKDTGVVPEKIQVWFSNRRAKEKKKACVALCADSNIQFPQEYFGNRYSDLLAAPPPMNVGPSRIYFPSRANVSK